MANSLILASCGGTSSISSSTISGISTSSPSSPVTSTPVSSTTIASTPSSSVSSQTIDEKIHSAAKALAESTSFSMNYNYDGEDFTDIYNIEKGYIYIDYDQSGYITLPFKDEKQIYAYSVDNNSITLEGRPENETGHAEFEDLLYGLPALAEKISKASLTGADYIQSNSEADVLVIAELLGFGSYAEEYYFYGVQFTIDDDNLVASLVLDSDYAGTFEQEWLTVTFTNLNDSTYALAENYLSSYQEPEVNLFGIAPKVLTETSENTYGFISGVSDIDKVLPSTDRGHANTATEVGFEVKTDGTHITSVSYVSSGFLSYAETITYDYENATISPTIMDALKTLQVNDSMLTWADCGVASTYDTLVSFYGEEIAATIPYIHDNALTGNWYASTFTEGEINIYSYNWNYTEEQWNTYVEKFVALLEENGYVEMAEGTEQYAGLDTYINEENGVIISIGSGSFDGMYFYKA